MKYLINLALFSILFFSGCYEESGITSPVDSGSGHQLKLIQLPTSFNGLAVETITYSKDINGNYGGEFSAQYSYQSNSGTVSQYSTLVFDAGAFSGVKTITQTFNTGGAAMDFGPPMQFQATLKYTYKITGVDLSGVNPATLTFVYIDANGNMYPVNYESIEIDEATGMLKVVNAELPHFSRYGFVN